MITIQESETVAWAIMMAPILANSFVTIVSCTKANRNKAVRVVSAVLADQAAHILIMAVLLEVLPLMSIYDTALYGNPLEKRLIYFRVIRAIYAGTMANLVVILINRSIESMQRVRTRE